MLGNSDSALGACRGLRCRTSLCMSPAKNFTDRLFWLGLLDPVVIRKVLLYIWISESVLRWRTSSSRPTSRHRDRGREGVAMLWSQVGQVDPFKKHPSGDTGKILSVLLMWCDDADAEFQPLKFSPGRREKTLSVRFKYLTIHENSSQE